MLAAIFGNSTTEQVLYYLRVNSEGYALGISTKLSRPISVIYKQLQRLEQGNVVVSKLMGRTRIYTLNPNWPFKKYLSALLDAAIDSQERKTFMKKYTERKRPRRSGKP